MKPVPLIRFNGYVSASTHRDNDNGVLSGVKAESRVSEILQYYIISNLFYPQTPSYQDIMYNLLLKMMRPHPKVFAMIFFMENAQMVYVKIN